MILFLRGLLLIVLDNKTSQGHDIVPESYPDVSPTLHPDTVNSLGELPACTFEEVLCKIFLRKHCAH